MGVVGASLAIRDRKSATNFVQDLGFGSLVGVFAALLCLVVAGLALFTPHKWALIAIGIPWTADRFARFLYELRDSAQPTP